MSSVSNLDEVFSLVANETRLEILLALWEEHEIDESLEPDPVPFSTLRKRVGVRDSGRFHYHLTALVPEFVQDHDDGYTLTYAGGQILGAAISGVYTKSDTAFEMTEVDSCPVDSCDGTLEATYESGHIVFECETCDLRNTVPAPPILVGAHDPERDPEVFARFTLTQLQKTARGFCQLCSGPMQARIDVLPLETDRQLVAVYECTECVAISHTNVATTLLDHPAFISLLHDADIDYRSVPPWRLARLVDAEETVMKEDPLRVEVGITVDDDELVVVMDEHLDVLEYSRD